MIAQGLSLSDLRAASGPLFTLKQMCPSTLQATSEQLARKTDVGVAFRTIPEFPPVPISAMDADQRDIDNSLQIFHQCEDSLANNAPIIGIAALVCFIAI